jgi:hypothetical protein
VSEEKPYTNEEMWKKTKAIRGFLGIWAGISMLTSIIGALLLLTGRVYYGERLIFPGLISYALHIPIREYVKAKVGWKGP